MKDLEISKELFNEVTNSKCHEVFIKDEFVIAHSNLGMKMVNVYEFVFIKCKEWALTNGYFIYSTNELSFIKSLSLETIETFSNGKDTEIECILKASEYILKELNENR